MTSRLEALLPESHHGYGQISASASTSASPPTSPFCSIHPSSPSSYLHTRNRRAGRAGPTAARPCPRAGRDYLPARAAAARHRGVHKGRGGAAAVAATCASGVRARGRGWGGSGAHIVGGKSRIGCGGGSRRPSSSRTSRFLLRHGGRRCSEGRQARRVWARARGRGW
jgi:hypothetical protein